MATNGTSPPPITEPYTPKNILITGGAGFIASHVVNRLVDNYPQYKVGGECVCGRGPKVGRVCY